MRNKISIFQVISPQKDRDIKKHLVRACTEMKRDNITQYQNTRSVTGTEWLISDRFKLIACKKFKVGSTNIARVLYTLDHLSEQSNSSRISKGRARHQAKMDNKNKTTKEMVILLKSYTKFVFVRPPLERLLSAYRDHRPNGWFKQNTMSFKTFLEKLISLPDNKMNPHIVSFTRMCNPCGVKYDFIGFMDNYETDMRNILRSVDADKYVILPSRNQTGYGQNHTDQILKSYLKDVPNSLIQKVYAKYYWDYFLFGFPRPDF